MNSMEKYIDQSKIEKQRFEYDLSRAHTDVRKRYDTLLADYRSKLATKFNGRPPEISLEQKERILQFAGSDSTLELLKKHIRSEFKWDEYVKNGRPPIGGSQE